MNIIAWFAFTNMILGMLLVWAVYEMRSNLISLQDQTIDNYRRYREIVTDLLKLKAIKNNEELTIARSMGDEAILIERKARKEEKHD